MRTNYLPLLITVALASFITSCGTKINITPENKQKLFDAIDCSEYSDDELKMTICQAYKEISFLKDGTPDLTSISDKVNKNFHVLSKSELSKSDNLIKKGFNKEKLGGEINTDQEKNLIENSYDWRNAIHDYHIVGNSCQSGRFTDLPNDYEAVKYTYFTWSEILDWMHDIKVKYGFNESNLAWKIYPGAYGEGLDSNDPFYEKLTNEPEYKTRTTILMKAVNLMDNGVIAEIDKKDGKPELAFNLGTLCPPGCKEK